MNGVSMKMNGLGLRAVAGIALVVAPVWVGAAVSVSPSGQPAYSIKIETPPGRGPEPSISIDYTGARNGAVGAGWTMSVGAQIARCAGIKAIDRMAGTINFAPTDKLCMNGVRLIALDDAGNPTVGLSTRDAGGLDEASYREYRIETDSRTRIRAYGMAGADESSGPKYFKVWHPDGGVSVLGNGPDDVGSSSIVFGTQSLYAGTAMTWMVSKSLDRHANSILFFYDQLAYRVGANIGDSSGYPSFGKDVVVKEIQYGPSNKVVFAYADRQDNVLAREETLYRGNKSVSVRLLSAISTYVNAPAQVGSLGSAVHVRTMRFSYDTSSVSGRPRLVNVQACTALTGGRCLPSTSFTYTEGGPISYSRVAVLNLPGDLYAPKDLNGNYAGTFSADFDGDGRADLLSLALNRSPLNILYRSKGNGEFEAVVDPVIANERMVQFTPGTQPWSPMCSISVIVRDFNGDARPDILRLTSVPWGTSPENDPCQSTKSALFLNTVGGFVKKSLTGFPQDLVDWWPTFNTDSDGNPTGFQGWGAAKNYYFIDLNGDGILDLITSSIGEKDHASETFALCPSGKCTWAHLGDGQGNFTEIPTNLAPYPIVYLGYSSGGGSTVADMNGDGLSDLLVMDPRSQIYAGSYSHDSRWADVAISRGDGNFDFKTNFDLINAEISASSIDTQGDGQAEVRVTNGGLNGSSEWLWYMPDPVFSVVGKAPWMGAPAVDQDPLIAGGEYKISLDFNGDGRTDSLIIVPKVDLTSPYQSYYQMMMVANWKQDRAFNIPLDKIGTMENGLACCGYKRQMHIGNFTGNSPVEILSLGHAQNGEANVLYTPNYPIPPDRLLTVREGVSGVTTITYRPAAATDRVTAEPSVGEGQLATAPAGIVVTSLSSPSGVPGKPSITEYAYAGLRADKNGRGSLGYRVFKVQTDTAAGRSVTTITRGAQDFPYVGRPMSTTTVLAGVTSAEQGQVLAKKEYAYCDAGNDLAARDALVAGAGNCTAIVSPIKRAYTRLVRSTGWELDGTSLPEQSVATEVNAAGYPTRVFTATTFADRSYTSTDTASYVDDDITCSTKENCRWWIARQDRVIASRSVPKVLLETVASSGGASPTPPADPPKPVSSAALAAILQLLLDD